MEPLKNSNQIVCRDSYFVSVAAVQELHRLGMRFIGLVKTAHRNFPSNCLGAVTMEGRGKWFSMIYEGNEGECEIVVVLLVDREREVTLHLLLEQRYQEQTFTGNVGVV